MFVLPGLIGNTQRNCFDKSASVAAVTWNPSDKDAAITLSGGNLTATSSGTDVGVRSTTSHSTGKYYFELLNPSAGTWEIGIANSTFSLSTKLGSDNNGFAQRSNGDCFLNNSNVGTSYNYGYSGPFDGQFCIDLTAGKWWAQNTNNGLGWNAAGSDPVAGTGSISFASIGAGPYFICLTSSSNIDLVLNVGNSAYSGTPPSGFGNW